MDNFTLRGNATGNLTSCTFNASAGNYNMNITSENITYVPVGFHIFVTVLYTFISVVGFLGNSVVLVIVYCNKPMRDTTNILIANLAVADLSFIVICVPFTGAAYNMDQWPFGDFWCRFTSFVTHTCAWASIYTLVLMAVDRYIAIVHPLRSLTLRTTHRALSTICILWVTCILANVPTYQQYHLYVFDYQDKEHQRCVDLNILVDKKRAQIFYLCFFTFAYVLPLAVITVLYTLVIRQLRLNIRATINAENNAVNKSPQFSSSDRAKRRLTRLVVIVTLMFAICWLPAQIIFIFKVFGTFPSHGLPYQTLLMGQVLATCLAYLNSCINPIVYAFVYVKFREALFSILCFCRKEKRTLSGLMSDQGEKTTRTELSATCRYSEIRNTDTHL